MSVWQDIIAALIVVAAAVWLVVHFRNGLSSRSGPTCSGCPSCQGNAAEPELVEIKSPARESR